jgi:dTDP-4-dehydrorhamnose reductase/SAM-dependent methyltransferase
MRILLFGGHGNLGTELRKLDSNIIAPTREEIDINDYVSVVGIINDVQPDIIINAAAEIDNRKIEKFPNQAIRTNIIGAAYVSMACSKSKIRLVYISTDYIYKGDRGNYKESDEILPFNRYSWTKLGGESSVVCVPNHLIIRTSFDKRFNYNQAFIDKWTSKDYVSVIAPMILEATKSPLTGVLNLGTERKSLYDFAHKINKDVMPVRLEDTSFITPYDTSLNLQKWLNHTTANPIARTKEECRICGSKDLEKYLDLGLMPLANNLEFTSRRAKNKDRFPLQVNFCKTCFHSQLSVVVNPEKMFSYYTYRSAINGGYVKHCREMAKQLKTRYSLTQDSFIIDIASNDGTLLKEFKDEIGLRVLGVDPASNLASIAEADGIETVNDFWDEYTGADIVSKYGLADIITATNVFAHVDDVKGFLRAARLNLKPTGRIIIEFPYLVNFIENYEYDTIYFEHLSYFGISSLVHLCSLTKTTLVDIEPQKIHGGTVRVTIARQDANVTPTHNVEYYYNYEKAQGFQTLQRYQDWASVVEHSITQFSTEVNHLKKQGKKIAAFAASAKGNTLLNSAGMTSDIIDYIADETPEKIGKFSPGTGIPIVNKHEIEVNPPDCLIILSWNFKEEIMAKISKIYKGKYIIPIPEFKIIEQ